MAIDQNRLRVCHFSSVHHVWDTRVFYRECVSLAKAFDVTLIAIGDEGITYKDGVKIIGIQKPKSFVIRFLFTIFRVFILAVKTDAAIYHIHDAEMVPFGIALSILGKKVIYDIHENTHDDILLKPWLNKSIRGVIAFAYNFLLWLGSKFLYYIVVLADPKFLHKFFVNEHNSTIIQNFANQEELKSFVVEDRGSLPSNHLFYLGMIRDMYYNIDVVLEAIYLLKKQGTICHLHLIGYFGSGTSEEFKNLSYWSEIQSQITFYGFLKMKEAYEISKICKIGLCIKNQPESMLVSHERKLFEYMAVGLPSIFCNRKIYTDLNERFSLGLSVNMSVSEEIAKGISVLLGDGTKLNYLAKNNLDAVEKEINWGLEKERLIHVYRQLILSV